MSGINILVVDDSRMSRMMLETIIKDLHPDWSVDTAIDGKEAIELAKTKKFDLMTLDYNMPGITGLEAAEQLKIISPNSKMALLTANIQDAIQVRCDDIGLTFIAKPITSEKIANFVG